MEDKAKLKVQDAEVWERSMAAYDSILDAKLTLLDRPHDIDPFVLTCIQNFSISRSQLFQDIFVLHQLGFKRGGYFVEFGATDGTTLSNTYVLEKNFGWSGIVSEPFPFWHSALERNRHCSIDKRCVWDESGLTIKFWISENFPEYCTAFDMRESDMHKDKRKNTSDFIEVETISLNDLLKQSNAPREVDFLSIDTEGSELKILSSLDFDAYLPKIITVEHNYNQDSRNSIHDLLRSKGYCRYSTDFTRWDDWYVLVANF